MKKLILVFTTVALAAASAANKYTVTLFQPSVINGTELKPGEYRVEVDGDKAVFKQGKKIAEATIRTQDVDKKFASNTVRYIDGSRVQEIHLGGTHTKLIFDTPAAEAANGTK